MQSKKSSLLTLTWFAYIISMGMMVTNFAGFFLLWVPLVSLSFFMAVSVALQGRTAGALGFLAVYMLGTPVFISAALMTPAHH